MWLCDKGVRADKHVCVKCFKDELNSDIKVRFERNRERGGGRGRAGFTAGICWAVGISSFLHAHHASEVLWTKPVGNTDMSCSTLNCEST